ncbi:MAG TPA: hypothetical protein VF164_04965, partial [Trueperaceae bacterium]
MYRLLKTSSLLAAFMLIAVLAGCTSPHSGPTVLHPVVLHLAEDGGISTQGVPTGPGGLSAVAELSVTVLDSNGDVVTFDAANAYDPSGSFDTLVSPAAESVTVLLPAGRYRFLTFGSDSTGELLAYGETVATVSHAATSVALEVHTLLGSAALIEEGLRLYVVAGEVIDLYLRVLTTHGSYDVPLADFDVKYVLDPELGHVTGSDLGARVFVSPAPQADEFVIKAVIKGWRLVDGVPTEHQKVIATYERPFAHSAGISLDILPPALAFTPSSPLPVGVASSLGGTAMDDVGVARVQVYEGPVLLASTNAEEIADGASPIAFLDPVTGAWTFQWTPLTAGAFRLTAVAIDTSGNESRVTREVAVEAAAPPPSIGGLTQLSSPEPFDEEAGNCAATELSLPGQGLQAVGAGLQAVGAVGGLFVGDPVDFEGSTVTPERLVQDLWQVIGEPSYHDRVAIVIVDDFGGTYQLPATLLSGAAVSESQLQAWADSGELAHGALVLQHMLRMLTEMGFVNGSDTTNHTTGEPIYIRWTDDGGKLVVQTVDTHGRDTDEIVSVLRASILDLATTEGHEFRRFVVNMSFAVVPCAVAADLGASSVATFEEYVSALRTLNGIGAQYEDELTELLTAPLGAGDDPLLAYLNCPLPVAGQSRCDGWTYSNGSAVDAIVNVAAAGNLGHDFPLYPSAWPTVISTSSLDVVGDGVYSVARSSFANSGEVAAPGALYELVSTPDQVVAYAGTSFSAPVVTL